MTEEAETKDPVHFVDGCVVKKDWVYVAARLDRAASLEYQYSVGFWSELQDDGSLEWWIHDDFDANVISVCSNRELDATLCLGMRGEVFLDMYGAEDTIREQLPDASAHGAQLGGATQIRTIGKSVFACGHHGQVYRRTDQGWHRFRDPLLADQAGEELTLNGIDGSGEDDLFVVGYHGRVLHFDGRNWTELDPPTNLHLERVCSVGRGEAYACGNEGTLLRITNEGIEDLSLDSEEHFWGLTVFNGRIYAATLSTLYVLEGDELEEIKLDLDLDRPLGFYRLDSGDGVLWSFGPKDLLRFDGRTWQRIVFAMNE